MTDIRISALPADTSPNAADVVPIDGSTTRKTTLTNLVNAGRPFASQAEAEAGTLATKGMSPLTVAQAIAAIGGSFFSPIAWRVPVGGTTNQLLGKVSDADNDVGWTNAGAGDLLSVNIATAAEIWAATAAKILTADGIFSAAVPVTLTDATTIAVDMSTFLNAVVTLGGNRTLGAPSNVKDGQSGCIEIIQDGTGSRTLAYHADWLFAGGTDPVLSTAAGTKDLLFYQVMSNGKTYASLVKAIA